MRNINVGSINGGNNQFNQNNNYNVKNVNNGGGGNKGGDPQGEMFALIIGVFGVVVVTASVYLRYFEPIFFWLKVGVLTAGILHMMTFVPQWRDPAYAYRHSLPTAFGLLLTAAQAWVILATLEAIPSVVLDIANQPIIAKGLVPQAMEVWGRFNDRAHRIITENLITVLCLAPAIALNLFYGLQHFLEALARSEQSRICATFAKWLHFCKAWGGPMSAVLTLAAYLAISGVFTAHAV